MVSVVISQYILFILILIQEGKGQWTLNLNSYCPNFQTIIIICRGGNFLVFLSMSYPLRSLILIPGERSFIHRFYIKYYYHPAFLYNNGYKIYMYILIREILYLLSIQVANMKITYWSVPSSSRRGGDEVKGVDVGGIDILASSKFLLYQCT